MRSLPVCAVEIYTFQIFQMHNSFLWSFAGLPERKRDREREKEKRRGGEKKSLQGWGFAWECAWPASRTMKTQRRGPHPALNHFSFPSLFYSRRRTSSYTHSWMGKHKVSSNVLQLNTVKKKKEKSRDYTSARAFQRNWEHNKERRRGPSVRIC